MRSPAEYEAEIDRLSAALDLEARLALPRLRYTAGVVKESIYPHEERR